MQDLNVTLIQTPLHWQDHEANCAMFSGQIRAIEEPTDLIVLPEMFTTGFTMEPEPLAQTMDGFGIRWLRAMAKEKQAVICGSLIIQETGQYHNRFVWMQPDGEYHTYDKRHLFRMANEHQHYEAGRQRLLLSLKSWRVMPSVCYDLRFPVWLRNRQEYDLLLCVANWPSARSHAWKTLLPARAIENQSYVIGVNRVGKDGNGVVYSGDSVALDYQGQPLAEGKPGESFVKTVTLSGEELLAFRERFPVHQDADLFHLDV